LLIKLSYKLNVPSSSAMRSRVVGRKFSDFTEEYTASTFIKENMAKEEENRKETRGSLLASIALTMRRRQVRPSETSANFST
jgi:hypothetical protein